MVVIKYNPTFIGKISFETKHTQIGDIKETKRKATSKHIRHDQSIQSKATRACKEYARSGAYKTHSLILSSVRGQHKVHSQVKAKLASS